MTTNQFNERLIRHNKATRPRKGDRIMIKESVLEIKDYSATMRWLFTTDGQFHKYNPDTMIIIPKGAPL